MAAGLELESGAKLAAGLVGADGRALPALVEQGFELGFALASSHSGVMRVSLIRIWVRRRVSGSSSWSSWRGYEGLPAPPLDVQFSTSFSTRSGNRTANSCATIPPNEVPTTMQRSQPTASRRAAASWA